MIFLLDSADLDQAAECAKWGWVKGITTNPSILAKNQTPAEKSLRKLRKIIDGPIFYQLISDTKRGMLDEANTAHDILGKQLVLKIPATAIGFKACTELSERYSCAITTIFSTAQALVANAAGAKYALYYHNRAKRLLENGDALASTLVRVLKRSGTSVIAASLKSVDEVLEAREAGVKIVTTTFKVLKEMPHHDLTEHAVVDFNHDGIGLSS